jgi:glutamine synthetase
MAKTSNGAIEKVLKFIKDKGIKFVDLKFMDFPGQWQHFTVPVTHFDAGSFEDGRF